ncbi:hypothetical protein CTU88_03385 [Streptomyces sp. JV178]|uniref:hypothetical protein n=1 Tax=Streptomyces sp. JV178 TaxID=858632 RepID=UPI000C1B259C|nr:hypothetical protein [Streptomyces sp. JV178]PIM72893.1 hypothetical protein CTU88_03385 [Streptomyces sp. JV178]
MSDRLSGALLAVGAALTIGGSFTTLNSAVDYRDKEKDEVVVESVSKAWSHRTEFAEGLVSTDGVVDRVQFDGISLLVGIVAALVAAVFLLLGPGRRPPLRRGLAVAGGAVLFGTTLAVVMESVSVTQWESDTQEMSFGLGFYLLTGAVLLSLAATALTLVGAQRATPTESALPQSSHPWPTPPAAQPYPPGPGGSAGPPPSSY